MKQGDRSISVVECGRVFCRLCAASGPGLNGRRVHPFQLLSPHDDGLYRRDHQFHRTDLRGWVFSGLDELITACTERVELVTGTLLVLVLLFAPLGLSGLLNHARVNWLPRLFAQHTAE